MKKLCTLLFCFVLTTGIVNSRTNISFEFILYDSISGAKINPIREKLQQNADRITADLGVQLTNSFRVHIWGDYNSFLNAQVRIMGESYPGSRGWVMGLNDLAIYYNEDAPEIAEHEFAHCVSLHINRNFGNNPRWLWEAIAVYEAKEFSEPSSTKYLVEDDFPTIKELNGDFNTGTRKIYDVGYLLTEYILKEWGKDFLIELIKNNGNIEKVLQISTSEFEMGWETFVEREYFGMHTSAQQIIYKIMPLGNSITRGKFGSTYRQFLKYYLESSDEIDFIDFVGSNPDPPVTNGGETWDDLTWLRDSLHQDIEHEGWGGFTINNIIDLPVSEKIRTYSPDIILLMIGTNNMSNFESNRVMGEYRNLLDTLFQFTHSHVIAAKIPPVHSSTDKYFNSEDFNAGLATLLAEYQDKGYPVTIVDMFGPLDEEGLFASDKLHPNELGNIAIAGVWEAGILDLISQPPPVENFTYQRGGSDSLLVKLSWHKPADFVNGYILLKKSEELSDFVILDTLSYNTHSFTDTLKTNTDIQYKIKSYKKLISKVSAESTVTIPRVLYFSVPSFENHPEFRLWYNRSASALNAKISPDLVGSTLIISGIDGAILLQTILKGTDVQIPLSLNPGVYLGVIVSTGQMQSLKFIIL